MLLQKKHRIAFFVAILGFIFVDILRRRLI